MTTYNCRHSGDQYRITKFTPDGDTESSYLCSHAECECPAGSRPLCRHRLMLPVFLDLNLVNSHLFLDWDNGRRIVDFNGHLSTVQSNETCEPSTIEPPTGVEVFLLDDPVTIHNAIAKAVGEPEARIKPANPTPWRRW